MTASSAHRQVAATKDLLTKTQTALKNLMDASTPILTVRTMAGNVIEHPAMTDAREILAKGLRSTQ